MPCNRITTTWRAIILRNLNDREAIEEALKVMKCHYVLKGNTIEITEDMGIELVPSGTQLRYIIRDNWQNQKLNTFIDDLNRNYDQVLNDRIEKLKLEEARLKEKAILEKFSEEEKKKKELALRKKRLLLETVKRKESAQLKRIIEEKATAIRERAARLGYRVKEEVRGKEKVMVLVRG